MKASTKVRVILDGVCIQPLTVEQAEILFSGTHQLAVLWALENIKTLSPPSATPWHCTGFAGNYTGGKTVQVQIDILE